MVFLSPDSTNFLEGLMATGIELQREEGKITGRRRERPFVRFFFGSRPALSSSKSYMLLLPVLYLAFNTKNKTK